MSRTAPLWLAAPSRFAALKPAQARLTLGLLIVLVAACFLALRLPDPAALGAATQIGSESNQTDLMLYEKIVAAVKGGDNYYTAAADALRAGSYPLRPFLTFRMPGLAVVLAALPEWLPKYLLMLLALTTGFAWASRIWPALTRPLPRVAVVILLLGSLLAFFQSGLVAFHEIWAAPIIALSLAMRSPGRWIEAVALGLAAMLIRETAALYAVIMAVFAWREGARREAIGWAVALGLFAVALGAHAWAVHDVTGPNDPASPGWAGLWGFGLFVQSATLATSLQLLPLWAAAPLVGLSLFGWLSWNDPLASRMSALLIGYAAAISLFARLDTFYWGLMAAPVLLAGLVFVPDAIRDLLRQSLGPARPKITVTRVTR